MTALLLELRSVQKVVVMDHAEDKVQIHDAIQNLEEIMSDNIGLSREGLGLPVREAVETVAGRLGIGRHLDKFPAQLSVGERQRVAIARAMAHEPSVVIADEPTASLDPINADEIMSLFSNLADEFQVTLVVGTHDWDRVEERGFRRVRFDLEKDTADGTVRATVSG